MSTASRLLGRTIKHTSTHLGARFNIRALPSARWAISAVRMFTGGNSIVSNPQHSAAITLCFRAGATQPIASARAARAMRQIDLQGQAASNPRGAPDPPLRYRRF